MKPSSPDIKPLLSEIFTKNTLVSATLSDPFSSSTRLKIVVRPLYIKEKLFYQVTEYSQEQAFHRNLHPQECSDFLQTHFTNWKQTLLYTDSADYHLLVRKNGTYTLLKKTPSKKMQKPLHDREKNYLLREGTPILFLEKLGIMNQKGIVYPAKKDKFRQINRFLEMIDDILPHLDKKKPLRVVDFGCGKAYLSFALYYFLQVERGYEVNLTGIDLKSEVVAYCTELAKELHLERGLSFIKQSIDDFQTDEKVDLVVSLHACDTATDAALEKAVFLQSTIILAVPCCQHELFSQVNQSLLLPLLKHGILKERFAALITDAARAELLELAQYQTQIMEFIDLEHTPKNLLIRAIKRTSPSQMQNKNWVSYQEFTKFLHITPNLETRLLPHLK